MKNLIILLALFTFVGLSTEMMAQTTAVSTATTAKKAKATKVPLSSMQKKSAKKACCAKGTSKSACSKTKENATKKANATTNATNVSLKTKGATEKKACTKGAKKGCCSKDKSQASVTAAPTMKKIVNKNAPAARPALTHASERQNN